MWQLSNNQESHVLNVIKMNQFREAPCILSRNNKPIVKMLYRFFTEDCTITMGGGRKFCCAWIAPTINSVLRDAPHMCMAESGATSSTRF